MTRRSERISAAYWPRLTRALGDSRAGEMPARRSSASISWPSRWAPSRICSTCCTAMVWRAWAQPSAACGATRLAECARAAGASSGMAGAAVLRVRRTSHGAWVSSSGRLRVALADWPAPLQAICRSRPARNPHLPKAALLPERFGQSFWADWSLSTRRSIAQSSPVRDRRQQTEARRRQDAGKSSPVLYRLAAAPLLLAGMALGPAAAQTAASAPAAAFPRRPVRIVVPYPAGGATDVLARAIAEPLGAVAAPHRGGRTGPARAA